MTAPGATGFGFTGLGRETTKGTAVAATHYIPVTRADGDEATDVLPDQGMRGSMSTLYGAVKGTQSATYDAEGDVYLDTIGFFLAGIMGEGAFVAGTPNTHTFTLNNDRVTTKGQCPSFTIWDYQGLQARKYAAATMSSFTLRCSAQELLTYSASFTSNASVIDTVPSPSFGTLSPIAAWVGSATVAGSPSTLVEEAEISFSRNVSVVQTVDGSTNPLQIWQGPLSVSGRLMFVAPNEDEFTRYLNVTQPSLELSFGQGTGSLAIAMEQVVYNSAKVERGEDFTQVSAQFDAVANTTNVGLSAGFGPITVTLQNSVAADIYINNP